MVLRFNSSEMVATDLSRTRAMLRSEYFLANNNQISRRSLWVRCPWCLFFSWLYGSRFFPRVFGFICGCGGEKTWGKLKKATLEEEYVARRPCDSFER